MANLQEYKCPCCGGVVVFDSGLQKMKCQYCDTEFDPASMQQYDDDLNIPADDMHWNTSTAGDEWNAEAEGMRVYVCQSCGGSIIADQYTAATACPFCGNTTIMMGNFAGDLKPDYVIPFKLDKEAAKRAYSNHITGKKLLPKVFKDQNHIDEIKGIYVPFWLFNADAEADIRYRATKVRAWSDRDYNYTETSFYSVRRSGSLSFSAVPVDGSSKMADDLMQSIEPFDVSEAVDFQTAYLSGYLADRYDVSLDDSVPIANSRIKTSTEQAFAGTVNGYSSVLPEMSSVRFNNGTANYALYPVWLLNTTYKDQHYTFAMNGQTGKFVGDLPVDKGKSTLWTWIIAAIAGLAFFGIAVLLRKLGIF